MRAGSLARWACLGRRPPDQTAPRELLLRGPLRSVPRSTHARVELFAESVVGVFVVAIPAPAAVEFR
jgi:hypothetical protein